MIVTIVRFRTAYFLIFIFVASTLYGDEIVDLVRSISRSFSDQIDCSQQSRDLQRAWCPVGILTEGKYQSTSEKISYLGLSMELQKGGAVVPSLLQTTNLAVLHLNKNKARVTHLKPSNKDEQIELMKIVFNLGRILKGLDKGRQVSVSQGLYGYLRQELEKPGYAVRIGAGGGEYRGKLPSIISRVQDPRAGDVYVVIEMAKNGAFVNIFPVTTMKPE